MRDRYFLVREFVTKRIISNKINKSISLIRGFFTKSHFWLLVIIASVLGLNYFISTAYGDYSAKAESYKNSGGPSAEKTFTTQSASLLGSKIAPSSEGGLLSDGELDKTLLLADSAAAVGSSHPFSNVIQTRDGLKIYKVQEGDTLSGIAAQFGISVDTIKLANHDVGSTITPGQEIKILPVSGILYEIEEGDTVQNVASRYNIDPELIKQYNSDYPKLFSSPGEEIILPYAKPINRWAYIKNSQETLPNLNNYFKLPVKGWNWGELHYKNAVDIANDCGTPIYAAAEGLVTESTSNDYWNEGYGNYIVIEHPNPQGLETVQTKYAHNIKNLVSEGDYIMQGEKIALIGSTGNTHGPTGCHLHFEVHGAQNPFVVN